MGEQHKTPASGFFNPKLLSSLKPEWGGFCASPLGMGFWNRLPWLLNMARSRMLTTQRDNMLDYEPIHLHISPAEIHPLLAGKAVQNQNSPMNSEADLAPPTLREESACDQRLGLDNFRFLLEQVPAVRTIEFSGTHHDPLENTELIKMVDYAYKFNGAECTIFTDGNLLNQRLAEEILKSRLHALMIRVYAHRPSSYSLLSGQPLANFPVMLKQVEQLVKRKQVLNSKVEIELCMTVDIHNFREIPDMIHFAEELGVNGLRLENYLPPKPGSYCDKTLYSNQKPVTHFLKQLKGKLPAGSPLTVSLPVLLDPDMSKHRHCRDPYIAVSVDAEFNIFGCSRQMLIHPQGGKVWDPDFFNNEMYQWLRSIYHVAPTEGNATEVPLPCRSCHRNMPNQ